MPPARIVLHAATLGAILLGFRSILSGPPPLWGALVACVGYVAIILAGVFVLRLGMFADVVARGPREASGVVLTFDDGPDPIYTRQVLDLLDEREAKATFFVIGRKVERHPDVIKEILRRGHDVGVHSFAHDRLFSLRGYRHVRRDLERAIHAVEQVTKRKPTLFRPPIGHTNPTIARVADRLGLTVVGWSVAGRDGLARADPKRVAARICRGLQDGAIVLLHDAAERDDHTPAGVTALRHVLDAIDARSLRTVPLRDWLEEG